MIILGKNGQLARAFAADRSSGFVFAGRHEIDLTDFRSIESRLDNLARQNPSSARVLINTAAYTNVDRAEAERSEASLLNTAAAGRVARWAAANDFLLVHYSTDFVYPGTGQQAWLEKDAGSPANHYGQTKLDGEREIQAATERYLIFRTSWLYGDGNNFPRTILRLAQTKKELPVVDDQVGAPTSASALVKLSTAAIRAAYNNRLPKPNLYGIYNLANSGSVSKYDFAKRIITLGARKGLVPPDVRVLPVKSDQFPSAARRPANSILHLEKFVRSFGVAPADWSAAFEEWLESEACARNSAY